MKFTLVTTCLNEMKSLGEWIADVEAQTRTPDEIIIVDSLSTDGTMEALNKWAEANSHIKILFERCSAARGRNIAINHSANDFVISTDMGCRLHRCWFEEMCKKFEEDNEIDVVAGNYEVEMGSISTTAARAGLYLGDGLSPKLEPGFMPSNRSVGYRKAAWSELGGLPEDLTCYADDVVMGILLNNSKLRVAYANNAIVYWKRFSEIKGYWKEAFGYGRGAGEAGILTPKYMNPNTPIYSKALAHFTAIKNVFTRNKRAYFNAIKKLDFPALALMPIIRYGMIINNYKGYSLGVERGLVKCQECRARISRSKSHKEL